MLFLGSFSAGFESLGKFTLEKYAKAYTDPDFADIIVHTAIFVSGSAVLATVLALFLAYLNTRTNIPFKFLSGSSPSSYDDPHILFAVSWVLLLNPSNGLINLIIREVFNLQESPFNIYT